MQMKNTAKGFSSRMTACLFLVLLLGAFGCSQKPVLYPNAHLNEVGKAQADTDIKACMALADEYGAADSAAKKTAKQTAGGAAVGGAVGAASGAIFGSAGRGAAAGAAGGAAGGLVRGMLGSGDKGQAYRNFVNKCLRDKGYEPTGWK
jgi:hypothetical protein